MESRQLLCGTVDGLTYHMSLWAQTTGTTSSAPAVMASSVGIAAAVAPADTGPNGMPLLHSLANAPTAVYLDFDGYGSNTPYDTDGNPAVYGAAEQSVITEAWRHISSYFSMFYTDVTTVVPAVPYSYSLISNSHQGVGYSYLQFPTTAPSAFNPSGDARSRQSGLAHEIGHNFGLAHQSDYDLLGNKTNEYSSGWDRLHGPVMGVDYAQDIHKWFIGHPSGSPSTLQDDVAVIAGRIDDYSRNDGFRPDDVPNSMPSARALTVDPATGVQTGSGIIERLADTDYYSFTSHGGQVRVDVVPPNPSMLDAKVEVYAADGTLLGAADAATNDQHLTFPSLPQGTLYVAVKSHGSYGDLGPYDLTVRSLPAGWASRDVGSVGQAGSSSYVADDGTGNSAYALTGGGQDIAANADEFHFAYTQLTGDGAITARVLSVENTNVRALAGVSIRETLVTGSRHATIGLTPGGTTQFRSRASSGGSTAQSTASGTPAPYWVRLARTGNVVTGFRSADGSNWTQVGAVTLGAGVPTVYVGLVTTAANDTTSADARFASVGVEGEAGIVGPVYNSLPAPAGLAVTPGTGTGLLAQWDAVEGATGYALERSVDGAVWTSAASLGAAATSYSDGALAGSLRYFYRVSAQDGTGRSVPSAVVHATNRPGAVTNLSVTSWQTGTVVLNWRDTNGETGYRVMRAPEGSDTWVTRGTVGANVPSYTDTGLPTGTAFRYRVVPLSPFGDAPVTDTVGSSRLPALSGLQFTEKLSNRMSLRWNPVVGATGYRIQRSTNGTDFTTLTTVNGNTTTTYDDRTVQPVKEYYYRVVGVNGRTESIDGGGDSVFAATPPATALPAGWQGRDVGGVGGTGATGYTTVAGGTFTVVASGLDIWNANDSFRYTYQPLVGNGTITARVTALENTSGSAKAGVMIRETTSTGSRNVFMGLTPENGTAFQWRNSTSGQTANNTAGGLSVPHWVRLTRVGNRFTAFRSSDGVTWVQQGTADVTMGASALVGLAVGAGDNAELATATFTNVTLSNNAPTVAVPASATPGTVSGVATTLAVLGADDHGESNLTYTWSATTVPDGAEAPTFSENGNNAAKSSIATFSRAGTYVLQARVSDTSGLFVLSSVTVVVEPTATGLRVTPAGPVSATPGQSIQFSAAVLDQFGNPMAPPAPQVTWSSIGGTINAETGLWVAPSAPGSYAVSAAAGSMGTLVEIEVVDRDVTAPALVAAASVRRHGDAGTFALPLDLAAAPYAATVEPRVGGPTTLTLTFSEPVVAEDGTLDGSEFLVGDATLVSAVLNAAGDTITLALADVADGTVVSVAVAGLTDRSGNELAGDFDVAVRALTGDVNGNGFVTDVDVLEVRRSMNRPVTASTFLLDLDLNGAIDLYDLLHVRRSVGQTMP